MNPMLAGIDLVFNLVVFLLMLRFFMQFAGISARNQMAGAIYQATSFVDVFNSIFPPLARGRFCTAALILTLLAYLIEASLLRGLGAVSFSGMELLIRAIFDVCLVLISSCKYIIIASVVVSWIIMFTGRMMPITALIYELAEPILAPFRKISPNLGAIDISPIFAFFALYILEWIVMFIKAQLV